MAEEKTEITLLGISSTPEEKKKKSYVPTSQTGLQDYSYWSAYAREHAKAPDQQPNFRRGRIWA
jgi:cyanobactin cluster PatC/TenC/TruC protein